MLLGGLWHGAGWNFVLWGGLHGLYLMINHAWRGITGSVGIAKHWLTHFISVAITFLAVMVAWIPFRASTLDQTLALWKGLIGLNGISLPIMFEKWLSPHFGHHVQFLLPLSGINVAQTSIWIVVGLLIIWSLPNTQRWLGKHSPVWNKSETELNHSKFACMASNTHFCYNNRLLFAISIIAFKKIALFYIFSLIYAIHQTLSQHGVYNACHVFLFRLVYTTSCWRFDKTGKFQNETLAGMKNNQLFKYKPIQTVNNPMSSYLVTRFQLAINGNQ